MDRISERQLNSGIKYRALECCLILGLLNVCCGLEEARPEVLLQPRSFNPHSYRRGASSRPNYERNGPVLFPTNPDDDTPDNKNGFIAITENSIAPVRPDGHPYPKVASKYRYRVPGRFDAEQNEVDPDVLDALADHGAKVLAHPPQDLKHLTPSKGKGKDYAFAYKVLDHLTGDDFSHAEERNARATSGEYRVKLPDGRTQIVSYHADKNGYKADVKYEPDKLDSGAQVVPQKHFKAHNVIPLYDRREVEVQRVPVRQLTPVQPRKPYDYDYEDREQQLVSPLVVLPTPVPTHYIDVDATPRPSRLHPIVNHLLQAAGSSVPRVSNVDIITTNARDYIRGSYVPSTVMPNFKSVEHYQRQVPVPTVRPRPQPLIINNGNHGLFTPQPKPTSSFLVTDRNGNVVNNVRIIPTTVAPLILVSDNARHGKNSVVSTTPQPFIINVVSTPSTNDENYKKKKK